MTSYSPEKRKYRGTATVLRLKYYLILSLFLPAVLLFVSCEEKSTSIGMGLLPDSDFTSTNSTDTISVFSYTSTIDSVLSNNKTYSYIGGLFDPYFGTSQTGFVGQLRLVKKFTGGKIFVVDSVKLMMSIAGAKGVLGTAQRIELFETGELLYADKDSAYYSNHDPKIIKDLGSFRMPLVKKDSAQTLFVDLSVSLGEYLMRDTTKLFQDNLETDFRSFFKGILFRMVPSPISKGFPKGPERDSLTLMALTFDQSDFIIRVYYNQAGSTNLYYDFTINPNSARYNLYSHDFSTADADKKIQHVNDNVKDTVSYLQGFNGIITTLRIPALDSIKKRMPLSVNKAKLTVPVFLDNSLYTTSTVPTKIYLTFLGSDGKRYYVPDYDISSSFFDGSFSSTTKKYTFNISSYVQLYLEGKLPSPARLDMYFREGEYKNVILKANHAASKVKFEFTSTRF